MATLYIVEKHGDTYQAYFGVENLGHVEPVGAMTGTAGTADGAIEALERQAAEQTERDNQSRANRAEYIRQTTEALNRP